MIEDDGDMPRVSRVGYGNPPEEHCFKRGVSGNPKGRPKKRKATSTLHDEAMANLVEAAREKVRTVENGKVRWRTKLQVAATNHVNRAAKGDTKAFRELLDRLPAADKVERCRTIELMDLADLSAEEASAIYLEYVRGG